MKMKGLLGIGLAVVGLTAFARANKYVAAGWEFAETDIDGLLKRADAFDKTSLDGCILYLTATGTDGQALTSRNILHQRAWTDADFAAVLPKYRELLSHRAFRESFLNSYRAPTNRLDWTDDAAWARVANNMRVAAKFAKACGFVGLQLDFEDYYNQNQYVLQDSDGMDYETLAKLVRRRGREVFSGVFAEFPDAKVLSYRLLSLDKAYMNDVDGRYLRDFLMRKGTELIHHFADGMLDALTPEATLIEGLEDGYAWEAPRMQYLTGALTVNDGHSYLVAPENREKYRRQVQASFGVYLDAYSAHTKGMWYRGPVRGSRLYHLRQNLQQATEAADEYLWFWGECGSWTGTDKKRTATTWEQMLPGLDEAFLVLKDPATLGRRLRARMDAGELKPINGNVACVGTDPKRIPAPYGSWIEHVRCKFRPCSFGCDLTEGDGDRSSLVAENCQRGCFTYATGKLRFEPGDIFGLSFSAKGRHVSATINWMKDGKWNWDLRPMIVPVNPKTGPDGWTRTDWSFSIPEDADGFGVQLAVGQAAGEKCWFDNIAIIPAPREKNAL